MYPLLTRMLLMVVPFAMLAGAGTASAQAEPDTPDTLSTAGEAPAGQAGAAVTTSPGSGVTADPAQNADSADVPRWIAEGRACDGCPWRRPGHALLQTTYINAIYGLANLGRGQVTARVTPATWWANMQHGWVWDLDDFVVNQFGHPYQGSNYFTAGRGNGLSFWESAAVTAFGSGTWEYFGETNKASLNDFINTTLGGIALGEVFHRTAWLARGSGAGGRGREIAAFVIDPVTGINRLLSGDAFHGTGTPAEMVPSSLNGLVSTGALWQGSNTRAIDSAGKPFLEMDLLYGDPRTGGSRTPYDAFSVRLRLGGGAGISEAQVRGRLLGQSSRSGRLHFAISQSYDFRKNSAFEFGAQSLEVNLGVTQSLFSGASVQLTGWGGVTVLGAVDSLPLIERAEPQPTHAPSMSGQGISEGPRTFDYGPGSNFGGGATFLHDDRAFAVFSFEGRHLYVLDGVRANHLLQRVRLDLLAPLRGQIGIGVSGEYFDRRTYYQDDDQTTRKFHYPQFGVYLTWRLS